MLLLTAIIYCTFKHSDAFNFDDSFNGIETDWVDEV